MANSEESQDSRVERDRVPTYRELVYNRYVSAFKGRRERDEIEAAFLKHIRLFDALLEPVLADRQPESLLEVACGSGAFLFWAARRDIPNVAGFDISAEQVQVAQSLGLPAQVDSYESYLQGRVEEYDLIVGMDIIEHLTRDEAIGFLDLCYKALRPEGAIFLTTPNGAGFRVGPVQFGDFTHETIFTPSTIDLVLRLVGFERVVVREIVPPATSLKSRIRRLAWTFVRLVPMIVDLVETGSPGSRIFTRNMAVLARKP